MNKKKYLIDEEPASANDIINLAKKLDPNYGADGIYMTSAAAMVLRNNGHTVSQRSAAGSRNG